MPAYIIARIEVTDAEAYKDYAAQTPGIIESYGGKFIVRGGKAITLEGDKALGRMVVVEFPDLETARTFYESPEYQDVIGIRFANATSELILVDGLPAA
ncbi:MAG: DUF1330 domain-containing protein [Rhodospirillales bacterium]|nr:DUF1330 domain-containing protein [Rhodospirillales bacterium]